MRKFPHPSITKYGTPVGSITKCGNRSDVTFNYEKSNPLFVKFIYYEKSDPLFPNN